MAADSQRYNQLPKNRPTPKIHHTIMSSSNSAARGNSNPRSSSTSSLTVETGSRADGEYHSEPMINRKQMKTDQLMSLQAISHETRSQSHRFQSQPTWGTRSSDGWSSLRGRSHGLEDSCGSQGPESSMRRSLVRGYLKSSVGEWIDEGWLFELGGSRRKKTERAKVAAEVRRNAIVRIYNQDSTTHLS